MVSAAISMRSAELGLISPLAGYLTDRLGPRRVCIMGAVVAGAGLIILSQTDSLWLFYVGFIIQATGMSGIGQVVVTTAVANWFRRHVGRAIGFSVAGYGLGALMLPLIVWAQLTFGWRWSLAGLGLLLWLAVIPVAFVLRQRPEKYGLLPDGDVPVEGSSASQPPPISGISARGALATRSFWLISIIFGIHFLTMNGITVFSVPFFESVEMAPEQAAVIAMLIPVISVIGRLTFGWVGDWMGIGRTLILCYFLQAAGLLVLAFGKEAWQFVLFLVLYGPSFGALFTLRVAALRERFGRGALGSIQGIAMFVIQLGGLAGPIIVGIIRDSMGGYQVAWLVFAGLCLAAVPLAWLAWRGPIGEASET
jgi:MFS family permease